MLNKNSLEQKNNKKTSLLLVFLFLITLFVSCSTTPVATKEDFGKLDAVHNVNMSKDKIYDKMMLYIANKYKAPGNVIQYYNKEQGITTINGSFVIDYSGYLFTCNYKLTTNIKNNKYKIEMYPLDITSSAFTNQGLFIITAKEAKKYKDEFDKLDIDILNYINGINTSDDF